MNRKQKQAWGQNDATTQESSVGRRLRLYRVGLRRQFLPLLIALTLLSSLGIAALAFAGTRVTAVSDAQARAAQDVRVERQLLADQGAGVSLADGHLVVGTDSAVMTLNGDFTIVERTQSLVNADATIYELEGPSLVAISTTLPKADRNGHVVPGSRALGDNLSGSAYDELLGNCGPTDNGQCHGAYSGVVTLHGRSYVASFAPLEDLTGTFVGALSVAIPLDSVLVPSVQLSVLLVLVGLLVALAGTIGVSWLFGSVSGRMFASLNTSLQAVAEAAYQLEGLSRGESERANRQTRVAMQVSEQARALDDVAAALAQGHAALHESAGEIWAETSQPGLAPDPAAAVRWARQAAIASGRIGTSVTDARDRCRQLVRLMNHMLAETSVAEQSGGEIERHARELRDAIEQLETNLGQRLVRRQPGHQLRSWLTSHSRARKRGANTPGAHQTSTPDGTRSGAPPAAGVRLTPPDAQRTTGEFRTLRDATGNLPAVHPPHPEGRPHWSGAHPNPNTSQTRNPRFSAASEALPGLPPELPSWKARGQHDDTAMDAPWLNDDTP